MKKSKPSVKYQGISMPIPFIEEIKKHIMNDPKYRSVADFAREGIREKMNNTFLEKRVARLELIIEKIEG